MARPEGAQTAFRGLTVFLGFSASACAGVACGVDWVSFVSSPGAGESGVFEGIAVPESS